jgi:catechol 2,3-dioxygenase-like lactoylglutathione lyase family enzyme
MFETATVHGTIAVSDLDRARKFYEGMLGFKVKDERSDGVRYEDAAGHYFLIYPSQFAGTDQSTHISFEVSDVEKAAAELRERGVVFEEYDLPGDQDRQRHRRDPGRQGRLVQGPGRQHPGAGRADRVAGQLHRREKGGGPALPRAGHPHLGIPQASVVRASLRHANRTGHRS